MKVSRKVAIKADRRKAKPPRAKSKNTRSNMPLKSQRPPQLTRLSLPPARTFTDVTYAFMDESEDGLNYDLSLNRRSTISKSNSLNGSHNSFSFSRKHRESQSMKFRSSLNFPENIYNPEDIRTKTLSPTIMPLGSLRVSMTYAPTNQPAISKTKSGNPSMVLRESISSSIFRPRGISGNSAFHDHFNQRDLEHFQNFNASLPIEEDSGLYVRESQFDGSNQVRNSVQDLAAKHATGQLENIPQKHIQNIEVGHFPKADVMREHLKKISELVNEEALKDSTSKTCAQLADINEKVVCSAVDSVSKLVSSWLVENDEHVMKVSSPKLCLKLNIVSGLGMFEQLAADGSDNMDNIIPILSLDAYLVRLVQHMQTWFKKNQKIPTVWNEHIGLNILLNAVGLAKMLKNKTGILLWRGNIYNVMLTCFLIAAKYCEDDPISLKWWAEVGEISKVKLHDMELAVCNKLSFELFVNLDDVATMYSDHVLPFVLESTLTVQNEHESGPEHI